MKKILTIIYLIFLTNAFSHTLVMNILDNKDDTITIVGEFSTGEKAVDAMVRLEALNSGAILFQKRLLDDGSFTLSIPTEPYQVVLDGGPDHQLVKEGIAPLSGYSVTIEKNQTKKRELSKAISSKNTWSTAYIVLISITLLLIGLSIYFSKKNTDKILKMIEAKN